MRPVPRHFHRSVWSYPHGHTTPAIDEWPDRGLVLRAGGAGLRRTPLHPLHYYYLILALALVTLFCVTWPAGSRIGRD